MPAMPILHRRLVMSFVLGLLMLIVTPAALAQEETPEDTTAPVEETVPSVEVPVPAVEIADEAPAEVEQAWTFRYLIPTSLVIALLVVVGSIVAYFLKVVRTRYRLIQ